MFNSDELRVISIIDLLFYHYVIHLYLVPISWWALCWLWGMCRLIKSVLGLTGELGLLVERANEHLFLSSCYQCMHCTIRNSSDQKNKEVFWEVIYVLFLVGQKTFSQQGQHSCEAAILISCFSIVIFMYSKILTLNLYLFFIRILKNLQKITPILNHTLHFTYPIYDSEIWVSE